MCAVVDRMVSWEWIFVGGGWEEVREGAGQIAGEGWVRQSDSQCKSPGGRSYLGPWSSSW